MQTSQQTRKRNKIHTDKNQHKNQQSEVNSITKETSN